MDEEMRTHRHQWTSLHQAGLISLQEARLALYDLEKMAQGAADGTCAGPTLDEFAQVRRLFNEAEAKRREADAFVEQFLGVAVLH